MTTNLQYRNKTVKYFKAITKRKRKLVMAINKGGEGHQYHVLMDITKAYDRRKFYRKYVVMRVKNPE